MTQAEQRRFIRELIGNVKKEVIANVPKMPEYWNGIELRQYIADKFHDCIITGTMDRARLKDYNNTIATTNL
jgi:hypothetical protein